MKEPKLEKIDYRDPKFNVSEKNMRFRHYDERWAKKLANLIWEAGKILQPVTVSLKENMDKDILDGYHRYMALKILEDSHGRNAVIEKGVHLLPCMVYENLSELEELRLAQLIAGNNQKPQFYGVMAENLAKSFLMKYGELKSQGRSEEAAIITLGYCHRETERAYVGWILKRLKEDPEAKIFRYIRDKASRQVLNITPRNLSNFLGELCYLKPVTTNGTNYRDEEYNNVKLATNWVAQQLEDAARSPEDKHSLCGRERLWACGKVIADILRKADPTDYRYPAFGAIKNKEIMRNYFDKLRGVHWDMYLHLEAYDEIYNNVCQQVFAS